jgi:hypothetical protein
MIKLYRCMSARSFRSLWVLEELGLNYKLAHGKAVGKCDINENGR